jgi:hypothetical protein
MRSMNSQERGRARWKNISVHQLGRPHSRLRNPNTGIPEIIVQPLYDIYGVAAGQPMGALRLFTVPIGQTFNFNGVTAFSKTFCHTNLVQSGMLESSYSFIVRGLGLYCQGVQGAADAPYAGIPDVVNFLSCYNNFAINNKPYFQGIGAWLPGGGGVHGAGAGTAPNFQAVNGWPVSDNIYSIPGGQFINPQENFSWTIDPTQNAGGAPSAAAAAAGTASGLMVWARCDGTLNRVAQ